MEIKLTEYKHCTVLHGEGRIDSYTAPEFEEALNALVKKDQFNIVFDMTDINFVSSSGWRSLIRIQKEVKKYNRGELVLVNVDERIKASMDLVGILPYFTFYDELTQAVGGF